MKTIYKIDYYIYCINISKHITSLFLNKYKQHNNKTTKMDVSSLSPEQKLALDLFQKGKNLFITGPGGTGKTHLIKHLIADASNRGKKCQVCAMTGCAALLLNCKARTMHSWSGMRLGKGEKSDIIDTVFRNKPALKNWKTVDILIIDEVSMLSKKLFEVLEELGRSTRRSIFPFGGIQVVFTGDFFQLPPVPTIGEEDTEKFCFESPVWETVFPLNNHIQLETIFRQKDSEYIKILQEIRRGKISQESKTALQKYVRREYNSEENGGIVPTQIFPTRSKVANVNSYMFNNISEPEYKFECVVRTDVSLYLDTGKPFPFQIQEFCRRASHEDKMRQVEYLSTNMNCEKTIILKKNSVVMCTFNIDVENGICNGSQGVVLDFPKIGEGKFGVLVKFYNGKIIRVDAHTWQSDDLPCVAVQQVPLCLSWALTIHKIQGATLPMGHLDIGSSIFEYGQTYVALSRIQSLDGLYIDKFYPDKIKANPLVIEFYEKIDQNRSNIDELIKELNISEKSEEISEEEYVESPPTPKDETVKKIIMPSSYDIKIKVKKLK